MPNEAKRKENIMPILRTVARNIMWRSAFLFGLLFNVAQAETFYVPDQYPTISQALMWAEDGDEIVVSPGRYCEEVHLRGFDVVLRSTDPKDPEIVASTIIDGSGKDFAVSIFGSEKTSCRLSGFTITGASNGIYDYCYGHYTKATISNNIFTGLGGIAIYEFKGLIHGNSIYGNNGVGIQCSPGTIENNLIFDNLRSGLYNCHGLIRNNVIVRNRGPRGAGLYNCNGTIVNNIIWGNTGGLDLYECSRPSYCCVEDLVPGVGNIREDPGFVGTTDFRLRPNSPCVDAGSPDNYPALDIEGSPRPQDNDEDGILRVNIGAYESVYWRPTAARHWTLYE